MTVRVTKHIYFTPDTYVQNIFFSTCCAHDLVSRKLLILLSRKTNVSIAWGPQEEVAMGIGHKFETK